MNHNINMGENFEAKEATRFLSDFFLIIDSIQYSLFMFLSVDFFQQLEKKHLSSIFFGQANQCEPFFEMEGSLIK